MRAFIEILGLYMTVSCVFGVVLGHAIAAKPLFRRPRSIGRKPRS